MVEAIFYVLRVAVAWRDLPPCYGPWKSVYTRWRRWCALGLWQEIRGILGQPLKKSTLTALPTSVSVQLDAHG